MCAPDILELADVQLRPERKYYKMPAHLGVSYTVWNAYKSALVPKAGRELMTLKVITLIS